MSQIITCHNKACRYRLPIHQAKNKNGQLFCSDKCANGCNPPANEKKESEVKSSARAYWDIVLKQKPRPEIPPAMTEEWA